MVKPLDIADELERCHRLHGTRDKASRKCGMEVAELFQHYADEACLLSHYERALAELAIAREHPGPATLVPEYEERAAQFRKQRRDTEDGKPAGTVDELERCAKMLDTYGPECSPANELGQVSFSRAMMEGTADEIRTFLANYFELEQLLNRLMQWDHLQSAHDGPYWQTEIAKQLTKMKG